MNHFEQRLYHKLFYDENYPAKDISGLLFIFGGAYIRRGDLTEGFLRYDFEGLIFRGAYIRNFTVFTFPGHKRQPFLP